jgi:peptide/nickel transport system permease protein
LILLPAFILGMELSGMTMRFTRNMMLEVLRQDYIRTAWAKGLRERVVILGHVLKNSLIPVATLVGLQLPVLVGAAIVVEMIFNLPGLGKLMINAIELRDYPVISAINVVMAVIVLFSNLLVDISYAWLDPRIRYR